MTDTRFGALAALACAATLAIMPLAAARADESAALPALGSAAAADQPELNSGATLPAGPDTRTLRLDKWLPFHPPHSPDNDPAAAAAVARAGTKIPTWSASVKYGSKTYNFTMVGASPLGKGAGTTTVKVVVVPLKFVFTNGTLDATTPLPGCSPAGAATMIAQSPLFQKITFKSGNITVGDSQYIDLFQRANFWGYVSHGNANYHTVFSATQTPVVTVNVNGPAQAANCNTGASGGGMGSVDNTSFDTLIRKTLIPNLKKYINPGVVPIFLSYNVVFGGAAGYHSAFATSQGTQVYGVSTYLDVGNSSPDSEVLSHEMAEFTDDPLVNNATPAWGHVGQVTGCQANLEVGDPLTGLSFGTVKMPNGFIYEVQDLTFFSWFFRESPSFAVNGYYTMFDYFKNPQPICH